MNRRGFLGMLFGAGAGALVAPSMVWPFRKIFLPTIIEPTFGDVLILQGEPLLEAAVQGIELETFAKEIPDLLFQNTSIYSLLTRKVPISLRPLRIPMRFLEAHENEYIAGHVSPISFVSKL